MKARRYVPFILLCFPSPFNRAKSHGHVNAVRPQRNRKAMRDDLFFYGSMRKGNCASVLCEQAGKMCSPHFFN